MKQRTHAEISKSTSAAYCICAYAAAGCGAWAVIYFSNFNALLAAAVLADLAATILVFVFSLIANNSSIYDPYWSVAPVPIALYWIFSAGSPPTLRGILVIALMLCWSVRLTFNWLKGWRGLSHEDWRYNSFRPRVGRAYWAISFLGFHLMPTLMVFLGLISVYLTMNSSMPCNPLDAAACIVTAAAIITEAVADRQLKVFWRNRITGTGTINAGLWRYSKHPNYFSEVLFWWGLYFFVLAGSTTNAWGAVGPVSMTLLFQFISVPMIEKHLEKRNPGYREQSACKPALIPLSLVERRPVGSTSSLPLRLRLPLQRNTAKPAMCSLCCTSWTDEIVLLAVITVIPLHRFLEQLRTVVTGRNRIVFCHIRPPLSLR